MKSSSAVVDVLNQVLTTELTSINHYFLHARMYKNWGFERLDEKSYKKSIKDMKQADALMERILFLEGLPNLQKLNPLLIGEATQEMLACDSDFQLEQIAQLKDAIALCESEQDFVSRNLLEDILEYEEGFLDWIETQHHLIQSLSIENYLQSQIEEDD